MTPSLTLIICNRGIETCGIYAWGNPRRRALTYRGTPEKQEIGSQVEVSGAICLDNWRTGALVRRAIPNREVRKPSV